MISISQQRESLILYYFTYWICPFSTASWRAVLFALFWAVKRDFTNLSLQRIWDWIV